MYWVTRHHLLGIHLSVAAVVLSVLVMRIIAWRMESTQGFHAIMNLILIPIWLLSGAFFPAAGAPAPLSWLMHLNPLTYGMAALRHCLYLNRPSAVGAIPAFGPSLLISIVFCAITFAAAARSASTRLTGSD